MSDEQNLDNAVDLRLLANFVHQIINPLNGVIGTLDNVIDGTVGPDRRDQRLRAVRAQLEWTVSLVRNLAYFTDASLEAATGGTTDTSKTCVIPQLIIEAAQFFQEAGASRNIEIFLEDRRTQYAVTGSPDLLRQVFMNLFDNAVKYADEGTTVRVVARDQKKSGQLIVEVTNQGRGFSFDEREKLFEIGYRGDAATAVIASGTGLGLYICRRIMHDVHAGTIEAEHSPRTHTTVFRLRFPEWRLS